MSSTIDQGLRALIARTIAAELGMQDDERPFPLADDLCLPYLDQSTVDFGAVADRVLEVPHIAQGLALLEAKKAQMLGHSISANPPR